METTKIVAVILLVLLMIFLKPIYSWLYGRYGKWHKKYYSVDAVNKRQKFINLEDLGRNTK